MLQDGVDALLTPDDNAQSMAGAIKGLLQDRAKAETLSKQARKQASKHDWSNILPVWSGLLTALAHSQSPPAELLPLPSATG